MKLIKYPDIEQFRHTVKKIKNKTAFQGMDKNDEPIFDYSIPQPTLKATGTVKLHGTNASINYGYNEFWCQSRERIITITNDNAGFAGFIERNKEVCLDLLSEVVNKNKIDIHKNYVSIYGEWCGKGIQKGVAINQLPKMFVVFGCKVSPKDDTPAYWVDCKYIKSPENQIYNIYDFETFELEIDFNHPEIANNKLIEITKSVEDCCPVGKAFGVEGTGEGVVWNINLSDEIIRWKVKGEKHSRSKVKTPKKVDLEKLAKIDKCVEKIIHNWRFEQGLTEVFGQDYEKNLDRKRIGEYLKWISKDTIKEESDIIIESGFNVKEVMPKVVKKAKEYFFEVENNL